MSETSQKIEALIFASSKPISEKEIKLRLDIHEDISEAMNNLEEAYQHRGCLLYTSPSPRDATLSRMPSSA